VSGAFFDPGGLRSWRWSSRGPFARQWFRDASERKTHSSQSRADGARIADVSLERVRRVDSGDDRSRFSVGPTPADLENERSLSGFQRSGRALATPAKPAIGLRCNRVRVNGTCKSQMRGLKQDSKRPRKDQSEFESEKCWSILARRKRTDAWRSAMPFIPSSMEIQEWNPTDRRIERIRS
jgi:hypothetical protein